MLCLEPRLVLELHVQHHSQPRGHLDQLLAEPEHAGDLLHSHFFAAAEEHNLLEIVEVDVQPQLEERFAHQGLVDLLSRDTPIVGLLKNLLQGAGELLVRAARFSAVRLFGCHASVPVGIERRVAVLKDFQPGVVFVMEEGVENGRELAELALLRCIEPPVFQAHLEDRRLSEADEVLAFQHFSPPPDPCCTTCEETSVSFQPA